MGMYTELHFNAELVRNPPRQVIDTLAYMTDQVAMPPVDVPDHPLFKTERWKWMLTCHSAYFPLSVATSFDLEHGTYHLSVRCNLKDYGGEIEKFLDWILPYVDADTECLGYHRYEEVDHPVLIYKVEPKEADEIARIRAEERARCVAEFRADAVENDRLGRQLNSIIDLCGRSRLGWVRVSAIHQLIITDPADEENAR